MRPILAAALALTMFGSPLAAAERVTHFAHANGISIAYQEAGDPAGPPVLLVMGLGAQLTFWPDPLVDRLIDAGFRIVLFDNRDVGLSEKFYEEGDPSLLWAVLKSRIGFPIGAPYQLDDMANDAVALLDHLGIDSAHVVGASMGGMIAQLIAIEHPDRTRGLVSIMSSTGADGLPEGDPEVLALLTEERPSDRSGSIERSVRVLTAIAGGQHPPDEASIRLNAAHSYDRSHYGPGAKRQILAILDAPDRSERLAGVTAATLVIHGSIDPLVPVEHGRDTAAKVPAAELLVVEGMGHSLPGPLMGEVAGAIVDHVNRVEAGR